MTKNGLRRWGMIMGIAVAATVVLSFAGTGIWSFVAWAQDMQTITNADLQHGKIYKKMAEEHGKCQGMLKIILDKLEE